jgi:hypothetical protein
MPIYNNKIQILGTPFSANNVPTTYTAESGRSRVVVAVMGYEGGSYYDTPTFTLSMGSAQFTLASSSLRGPQTGSGLAVNLVFYLLEKDIPAGSQSITFSATPNEAGGGRAITLYTLSGVDQENPIYLNTKSASPALTVSVPFTVKARSGSFAIATLTSNSPSPPPFSATSGWTIRRDYVNSLNDFSFGIFDKVYDNDVKEERLTVTGDTSTLFYSNLLVFNPWIRERVELDLTANGYTYASVTNFSNNATLTINVPANTMDGDLLLAFLFGSTDNNPFVGTPPTNWTTLVTNWDKNLNGNFNIATWVGYRIANNEPVSYSFSAPQDNEDDVGWMFRVIGADKNNPIDTKLTNTTDTQAISGITTNYNNSLVMYYTTGKDSNFLAANDVFASAPETTQILYKRTRVSYAAVGAAIAYERRPVAGNTGSRRSNITASGTINYVASYAFAIKEAPKYILQAERFKETGIYQSFSDNFNRANTEAYATLANANYGELGPDWEIIRGGFRITANTFDAVTSDSYAKVAEATVNFSDDHEAEIRIATRATFDSLGPAVRIIANGCYAISSDGTNNSDRRIAYIKDNSTKIIIGTTNITFVAGDIIKLRVQGSTLTAYKNGVQIDQVSNTAITSGQPGIFYNRGNINTSKGDNFYAVDLNPTPQRKVMQIFEDGTIQAGYFSEKELLAQMKVHANSDIWVGGLKEV